MLPGRGEGPCARRAKGSILSSDPQGGVVAMGDLLGDMFGLPKDQGAALGLPSRTFLCSNARPLREPSSARSAGPRRGSPERA